MNVGETDPTLRRIPIRIDLADGSGLASAVDTLSPTVLVANGNGTLVAAGGSLLHVSNESRLHEYEASAAEALTPGFLLVVVMHASIQTAIAYDFVGQCFAVGETDPTKLRQPLTIYDDSSPPALATGATVTTGSDLQSRVGGAFADDGGSLVEIGHGAYFWQALAASAAVAGRAYVKYESAGFEAAIAYVDVAPATSGEVVTPPAEVGPAAIVAQATVGDLVPTIDLVARALSRLPHMYRGANG